jgi:hypothetical protein
VQGASRSNTQSIIDIVRTSNAAIRSNKVALEVPLGELGNLGIFYSSSAVLTLKINSFTAATALSSEIPCGEFSNSSKV